jgi:alpha-ketoglutarate-dependent taurine dioxygenase
VATLTRLNVRPVTTNIGAVIDGVDLTRPVPPETVAEIRKAFVDHGVIFFQDQDITIEQFWAFMSHFGQPHVEETTGTDQDKASDVQTADYSRAKHATSTWHSDVTSMASPPAVTALRSVKVPEYGGDTCWSSMSAAYDALSEPMKRMLDGLTAVHSIQPTYDRMKDYAQFYEEKYSARHSPERLHPVVTVHPESGRKTLFVNEGFTTRIVELSVAESAAILGVLFSHVQSPLFTMRWHWTANDVAFWDNRSVQHFAVPDYDSERLMQRISLAGEPPAGVKLR